MYMYIFDLTTKDNRSIRPDLDSVQADDVPNLKDFGMVLQLLTEDGATDLPVGLIGNLQAGAEVCGVNTSCGQNSNLASVRRRKDKILTAL